jgi:hypothetical protein
MNINSPISLSICLTCVGFVLGETHDMRILLDAKTYTGADIWLAAIFSAALISALITGFYAWKTKSGAKDILKEIRSRKPIPWPHANESQRSHS